MTEQFGFRDPVNLWLLLLALPLLWLLFTSESRRRMLMIQLGLAKQAVIRWGRISALFIAAVALCLALARPYSGFTDIPINSQGRDIFAIVDVSLSMRAEDTPPSRLELAKRKLIDLVNLLSRTSARDRIAIILFSGDSYLYCPPTNDFGVAKLFINSIATDLITAQGSALNVALETAANSVESLRSINPVLLLLSDGEDTTLDPRLAVELLKSKGLKLNAIGFGTPEGAPIPDVNRSWVRDRQGRTVHSKLDHTALEQLTESTGGVFSKATITDNDLRAILAASPDQPNLKVPESMLVTGSAAQDAGVDGTASETPQFVRAFRELGAYLIWFALILIGATALSGRRLPTALAAEQSASMAPSSEPFGAKDVISSNAARRFALLIPILVLSSCLVLTSRAYAAEDPVPTEKTSGTLAQAEALFNAGEYDRALSIFQRYAQENPQDAKIQEALASALYKSNQFAPAAEIFERLSENAATGRDLFRALYNLGNTQLMQKNPKDAIESYKRALEVKPEDAETLHNLEMAKQVLEQQQQQQEKEEQKKEQENQEKRDDNTQQKQPEQQDSQQQQDSAEEGGEEKQPEDKDSVDRAEEEEKKGDSESEKEQEPKDQGADSKEDGNQQEGDEREKQASASESTQQAHDAQALAQEEARAWLDSLSEAPLLLRRKVSKRQNGEQSW